MSSQRTFSSSELIVTLGSDRLTGWIDGEYLTVAYDSDFYNFSNGADGEVARVKNEKRMATITARFLQTSASNDVLSAYLLEDLLTNSPQPLVIKDLNGNTILTSAQTTVMKPSDISYGVDATAREWTLKAATLIGFVGGNFVG